MPFLFFFSMCRTMLNRCALDSPDPGAYFTYLQLSLSPSRSHPTLSWSWIISHFERIDAVSQKFLNSKNWILELKNDLKRKNFLTFIKCLGWSNAMFGMFWKYFKPYEAIMGHYRAILWSRSHIVPLVSSFFVKKDMKITYKSKWGMPFFFYGSCVLDLMCVE